MKVFNHLYLDNFLSDFINTQEVNALQDVVLSALNTTNDISLHSDGLPGDQCLLRSIANTLEEDHEAGSTGARGVQRVADTSEWTTDGPGAVTRHNDVLGHRIEVVAPQIHQRRDTRVVGLKEIPPGAGQDEVSQRRTDDQSLYQLTVGGRHVIPHACQEGS